MNRTMSIRKKIFIVLSLVFILSSLSATAAFAKWETLPSGNKVWTEDGKRAKGWKKIDGNWYYFNGNGILQKSRRIGDYYVNARGVRVYGLYDVKGVTYYFSVKSGQVVKGKRIAYKGNFYRTDKYGRVVKRSWIGSTYYAGNTGAFVKGLAKIGGNMYFFYRDNCQKLVSRMVITQGGTYFFKKDGKAAQNQRVKYNNKIYGFGKNFRMVKSGTLYLGGSTYYFGSDGVMATGLRTIGGKQFYFYSSGRMAVNTTITLDKYSYEIDSKGVVVKKTKLSFGERLAAYAQKFVGRPYKWGGTDPGGAGADCSGFCYAVYGHFGITLPRVADDQMHGPGKVIKEKDMRPGDLIFFNQPGGSSDYACHVTMYIGNDQICHAANTKRGIVIDSLSWYRKYVKFLGVRGYW